MSKQSFEQYLEEHGTLTYSNVGVSMMPLLRQGRDLFTVKKKDAERSRVGDVVLYKRPPDQFVLHRVIEVRPNDYVILGDNCLKKETGITDEDILGIMTEYVRNGKSHKVSEKGYQAYTWLILHTIPARTTAKRAALAARRLVKKLLKVK